jgi:XTP/dITP diphosphohydrolase
LIVDLCFATNNKNKILELKSLIDDSIKLLSLDDIGCHEELEETQNTLEGNSWQKAQYVYEKYKIDVFADDTGLEVEHLLGKPGVLSARYAGGQRNNEDNIDLLLAKLEGVESRKAQFRTVISLICKGESLQFEGVVEGAIGLQRLGIKGFGYDSIFIPQGQSLTFAQMTMNQKNMISHRGIAVNKLVDHLNNQF